MDRQMELDHLVNAERAVADGERHIARQEQMVSDLERGGHDTKLALETLAVYRRMHAVHAAHRNLLKVPNPILQRWRVWLKAQFIGDVPPEDAFCEFECEKSDCQLGHWETCRRRLAYLELSESNSASKSPAQDT